MVSQSPVTQLNSKNKQAFVDAHGLDILNEDNILCLLFTRLYKNSLNIVFSVLLALFLMYIYRYQLLNDFKCQLISHITQQLHSHKSHSTTATLYHTNLHIVYPTLLLFLLIYIRKLQLFNNSKCTQKSHTILLLYLQTHGFFNYRGTKILTNIRSYFICTKDILLSVSDTTLTNMKLNIVLFKFYQDGFT